MITVSSVSRDGNNAEELISFITCDVESVISGMHSGVKFQLGANAIIILKSKYMKELHVKDTHSEILDQIRES